MSADLTAEELGRVHLIGIGGVGMSGLARLLLVRGIPVSGSELREWPHLATLRALGGTIFMSHQPANLDGRHWQPPPATLLTQPVHGHGDADRLADHQGRVVGDGVLSLSCLALSRIRPNARGGGAGRTRRRGRS